MITRVVPKECSALCYQQIALARLGQADDCGACCGFRSRI
jgi:hypothetical protein